MNNVTTTRLYFLFALFLLLVGWKLSESTALKVKELRASQDAQIERVLGSLE
jgi:hypothetical protein